MDGGAGGGKIIKDMDKTIIEKRQFPRISTSFPIRITPDFLGKTVDISETGLRFILEKPLSLSKAEAKIELSPEESIDTEFKVIWNKHLVSDGKFIYGACLVRLKERDLEILRKILAKSKNLNEEFVKITIRLQDYLTEIKNKFDEFDLGQSSEKEQIHFIALAKEKIFSNLDMCFSKTWEIVKNFNKEDYKLHRRYYQKMLVPLFECAEVNMQIYSKPLGYAGDFITMNYIYDYNGDRYFGKNSYEKLINNYTCNIPFSLSNIDRKNLLKIKILEAMRKKENTKILSIGSGSMRELLELLEEGKINKNLTFRCLDFEKKAIDFVKNTLDNIEAQKKRFLGISYLQHNIIDIIKNKIQKEKIMNEDLIYVSGIFDYLKDISASKLARALFQLLNKEGELIICNASAEHHSHRTYYEFLGEWEMIYRTKENMISWFSGVNAISEIKFQQPSDEVDYLFLVIKKS